MTKPRLSFYADLLERTLWSFIGGFAGGYLGGAISGQVADLSTSARMSIGLGAGIVSVLKGLAAVQLPWTAPNSASVLPEKFDPPTGDDGQIDTATLALVLVACVIVYLIVKF